MPNDHKLAGEEDESMNENDLSRSILPRDPDEPEPEPEVETAPAAPVDALVPSQPPAPPPPDGSVTETALAEPDGDVFVCAENPEQMASAKAQLVAWCDRRVEECRQDHEDLSRNLQTAVEQGWRSDSLERQVDRALSRLEYYAKMRVALLAGYSIVPNFPGQVFAVRTSRTKPVKRVENVNRSWGGPGPGVRDALPDLSPAGEGHYVSSETAYRAERVLTKDEPGKAPEYGALRFTVSGFRDVEFPFMLAKPAVLDAAARAMALKVFDEMVVTRNQDLEARGPRRDRGGDPIVVGRII